MKNFELSFPSVQREFHIRYYLWGASEFEKEIDKGFPSFRLFRTGPARQVADFMEGLDKFDRNRLSQGLLKKFHPEAVGELGESSMVEGQLLIEELREYRSNARSAIDSELSKKRLAGEKVRFIGKHKAYNVMEKKFRAAFDVEPSSVFDARDPLLEFKTKCGGGWVISTFFWFGRGERLIQYSHTISSELTFPHAGKKETYMANHVLASMISFCSWLGISSQTEWEYLTNEEELMAACDAAIILCRHFLSIAPKLLKGLEVDSIIKH